MIRKCIYYAAKILDNLINVAITAGSLVLVLHIILPTKYCWLTTSQLAYLVAFIMGWGLVFSIEHLVKLFKRLRAGSK
jgi:hypothetical protein